MLLDMLLNTALCQHAVSHTEYIVYGKLTLEKTATSQSALSQAYNTHALIQCCEQTIDDLQQSYP